MAGGRIQTNISINDPSPLSILVQARSPLQTVYVQKIVYAPSQTIAGTVLSFIDSLTGQSIGRIVVLPDSAQAVPYVIDYATAGEHLDGTFLSKGASLQLSILSGGVVGRLHIKAYQLPNSVVTPTPAPMTAGFTK